MWATATLGTDKTKLKVIPEFQDRLFKKSCNMGVQELFCAADTF